MKSRQCKIEGCKNPVWSNGLCQNHITRKPFKRKRISVKKEREKTERVERAVRRHMLFQQIWKQRPHKSEVSGARLGREALSTFFHHILPKSKYPQGEFDPENIIMLTPDEHANVESDMFRYEEVNRRREQLLKKYNLI